MTGSILGFVIFWIMVVAVLAAGWRQPETRRAPHAGQAARPPAGRLEESLDGGSRETRASPPAGRHLDMPARQAAGTAGGKRRAA